MKKTDVIWGLSLLIIGICTLILAGSGIIGAHLPDVLTRVLGILDLLCLPVLAFTTVKRTKKP